ncbi:MAG: hypothetical protein GEU98_10235 [Pseudonocardiaceae bacterium]|nr:hypothetical protein [Pseudonocardiaceae bacterium]
MIDRLIGLAWAGGRLIDPRRIAMVGHSLGGAGALGAMSESHRIHAGVNMDGRIHVQPDRRAYVSAFVDRHLRRQPEPLLDRPSTRYPEVSHWP